MSMKLTGGTLYWPHLQDGKLKSAGPETEMPAGTAGQDGVGLDGVEQCEVVILGGGIAGALCAYELTRQGIDTVLVEKHRIGEGSTSANTGMLQVSNDRMLSSLIRTMGERRAVEFYRLCADAIDWLERIGAKLEGDIGFARRSSVRYASSTADVEALRHEGETLRRCGFEAALLGSEEVARRYPFRKELALYMRGDAEVNPLRLTLGLISAAKRNGLRAYERTATVRIDAGERGVVLHTACGGIVRARRAVLAPGYEAAAWRPHLDVRLDGTYSLVTEPVDLSVWPERSLIWETARPYLYLRTTPDGRAIIGGFDEPFRDEAERDRRLASNTARLLRELAALFPSFSGVKAEYAWCGTFAHTEDGLPLIGEQPQLPGCLFTLGYGGNGLVYSALAARRIGSWVRDRAVSELEPLGFRRMMRSEVEAGT